MDIAVLSDIHGNYAALQTCVDYALKRNIDTFLFLGDYLGELAYPQKTMDIIWNMNAQYHCYFVKGNKEDYWLNYRRSGESGWKENDSTTGSLLYTYRHLSERDMDFFSGLLCAQEIKLKDLPQMTLCHGSPDKVNEKMLPDQERTFEIMEQNKSAYILCGHTHIQGKIQHKNRFVFNPGSVGVPFQSNGKTQFLILHGEEHRWKEEFISLAYDVHKVIDELYESGLNLMAPCWCRVSEHLLLTGKISHGSVLARAMDLCRKDTGNCSWPDIPERYWEQAVAEMIL